MGPRPVWLSWAQALLWTLWIPVLAFIPLHADLESASLLGVVFVGGAVLGWFERRWSEGGRIPLWIASFERVALLLSLWLLVQRLWLDEWEEFPILLTTLAVALGARYLTGFVVIYSRQRLGLPAVQRDIWQYFAHWSVYLAVLSSTLGLEHWQAIATGLALILCAVSSTTFMVRHLRHPDARSHLTVATQITLSRIVLAPVFIAVFFYDGDASFEDNHLVFQVLALLMAIASAVTDWLDGHLARKWGEVTTLGKYLDPWSDKVATMTMFLCFLGTGWASVTILALIYYRESAVETLRTLAATEGEVIAARRSGKWKTGIQIGVTIGILVFGCFDGILRDLQISWPAWELFWRVSPRVLMWIVAGVTVLSGVEYMVASRKLLSRHF